MKQNKVNETINDVNPVDILITLFQKLSSKKR